MLDEKTVATWQQLTGRPFDDRGHLLQELRVRERQFAIGADVREVYHAFGFEPDRTLWLPGGLEWVPEARQAEFLARASGLTWIPGTTGGWQGLPFMASYGLKAIFRQAHGFVFAVGLQAMFGPYGLLAIGQQFQDQLVREVWLDLGDEVRLICVQFMSFLPTAERGG